MQSFITLKPKRSRPLRCGHPWIFSGAIAQERGIDANDCVQILDADGSSLGWGLYSPKSQIRVRAIQTADGFQGVVDERFLAGALHRALTFRHVLGLGKGTDTTGFRLVNSEGDGIPGLIVDVFEDVAIFQTTTRPMALRSDLVVKALQNVLEPVQILRAGAPEHIARLEGFENIHGLVEGIGGHVEFQEEGLKLDLDLGAFQKTGHYADMREHRKWIGSIANGARVLDAYCYTGGFGLAAAAGGAVSVHCVDSSATAIERVRHNAALNELQVDVECMKVEDFLRSAFDRGQRFDLIVLDPPKLASRKEHTRRALKMFEAVALQASRLFEERGVLALGSCSETIGEEELLRILSSVAAREGLVINVIRTGSQAADHPWPAAMKEGRYLTFLAARVARK